MSNSTERPPARALSDTELPFRLLVESVKDYAIFMLDPSGYILTWNAGAERIKGYTRDEIIGQHFSRFYPAEAVLRGWPQQELERAAAEGRFEDEGWRLRKDGSRFWANVVISAVHDGTGKLIGFGKVTRDLTDRRNAEETRRRGHDELEQRVRERTAELREADRQKNQFLAMLAHELRNPLAPVHNALQILQLPSASNADRRTARNIMERQVQHLARLVDDLLDVSRVMQDRIELQRAPTNLRTLVDRAVETVQPMITARRQTLSITLPSRTVRLDIDVVRVAQAISNLLLNAAKFTDIGGKILVNAEADDDEVVLHVKDTGIGIAPEFLPHVFELFTQGDRSLDRSQGGLGIGLTLVRKLIQLHGGTVQACSEGIGRGSEFIVRLPIIAAKPRIGPRRHEEAAAAPKPARKVLVVDDNVDTAESTAMLLRLSGHQVHVAYDGASVLEQVDAFQPDVVLLDIGLPGIDGYEVARSIRARADHRSVVLVAVTGYGQAKDRQRSRTAGFSHHLTKPFDLETLQALIAPPESTIAVRGM